MAGKIILAEFSVASLWGEWVSYSGGVWYSDFNATYSAVDPALSAGMVGRSGEFDIKAVIYRGLDLVQSESITECFAEESFYWDRVNRTLYAHFPGFDPPDSSVRVGVQVSIASELYDAGNGIIYQPHLKDMPPMTQEKDRLFFKRVSTLSWPMTINNASREYDGIHEWGVYNQVVRYYLGSPADPIENFIPIRTGRIKDFSFRGDEVVLNVQDLRAQLSPRFPVNTFTLDEYADMDEDQLGKVKPVAYGKVFGVDPPCLNAAHSTGPYVFLLADPEYGSLNAITEVRVDGTVVTPDSSSLSACTVTLTAAQVKDGDKFKELRVDFDGYDDEAGALIQNPLDIIVKILADFAGIEYGEETFDTVEWARERLTKPSVGLYVAEPIEMLSAVERMMVSTRGGFLVGLDGRYTFRTPNYETRPAFKITDDDWYSTPEVSFDTSEIIAYARVGYRKSEEKKSLRYVEDRASVAEVFNLFNIVESEEFESALVLDDDAEDLAADIMALSKGPAMLITGTVGPEYSDLEIGKNFEADVNRFIGGQYVNWFGTVRGEILAVSPNIVDNTTELTLRVVEGVPAYDPAADIIAVYGDGIWGDEVYA